MPSSNKIDKEITIDDIKNKLTIIKERQKAYETRVEKKDYYAGFTFFGRGFGCSAKNKLEATKKIIAKTEALIATLKDNPKSLEEKHLDFSLSDCREQVRRAATQSSVFTKNLGNDFADLRGVINTFINKKNIKRQPTNKDKTSELDSEQYNMYSLSMLKSQTSSRASSTMETTSPQMRRNS